MEPPHLPNLGKSAGGGAGGRSGAPFEPTANACRRGADRLPAVFRTGRIVNAPVAGHRTVASARERGGVTASMAKIQRALERVRSADAASGKARQEFRRIANAEIAAGRTTKSEIARALGVSRQRVQKMLED
jgi:hypothetical protein